MPSNEDGTLTGMLVSTANEAQKPQNRARRSGNKSNMGREVTGERMSLESLESPNSLECLEMDFSERPLFQKKPFPDHEKKHQKGTLIFCAKLRYAPNLR